MTFETVLYSEENGIATITLNRPDKRNAISYELIEDLLDALATAEHSNAQVAIITGAGKAFCAGMDLDNLRAITGRSKAENLKDSQTMAALFRAIYDFPKPTIAAVNGAAIAGGCGIATLCDFTVASEEAKFGYTEVKIGFIPAIVSTFLILQVGEKRARDLLLTGRIIDASEAKQLGLVNDVIPGEQLMEWARELATTLMQNSPASLRATKRLLSSFTREALDQQIALAVEENARIRTTQDFREGVASFLEKRKPQWTGK
ncbi:MAG TPA: enoyl-CoA hydratase-related protein [Terriglobales bacterium]|jgi:methylglutaconyl-CoA hydratase|nr:enoyl-CoA hydratase-related protein [Terriglobales bacterium]